MQLPQAKHLNQSPLPLAHSCLSNAPTSIQKYRKAHRTDNLTHRHICIPMSYKKQPLHRDCKPWQESPMSLHKDRPAKRIDYRGMQLPDFAPATRYSPNRLELLPQSLRDYCNEKRMLPLQMPAFGILLFCLAIVQLS